MLEMPRIRAEADDGVVDEWDVLLNAVKSRLKLAVGSGLASAQGPRQLDTMTQLQASVLDCVTALDQLHGMLLELRHQALHDGLTELPNRAYFRRRADQVLASATPQGEVLTVLYIDLDGFKLINDAHGHAIADEALPIVAARLAGTVRSGDMVSRRGGDEFACLLPNLPSREQLSHIACKMFDAVAAPLKIGPLELAVRPSIGIASFPNDGESLEALLESADAAMYHAKQQKSGYAFFDRLGTS